MKKDYLKIYSKLKIDNKYFNIILKVIAVVNIVLEENDVVFLSLRSCGLLKRFKKIGPTKLLRLQDVETFRSDHPRKKSGIQLRSQIV